MTVLPGPIKGPCVDGCGEYGTPRKSQAGHVRTCTCARCRKPQWTTQPRSRLNVMSKRRQAVNRERSDNIHARYGQHPPCAACPVYEAAGIDTGCDGRAVDGHEILSRARSGRDANLTDPDGVLPVGRLCHERICANDAEAVALGLSRHSWDRP